MRKTLLIIATLSIGCVALAQSVQEAKRLIYVERFQSAQNILHAILKNDISNGEAWWLLTRVCLQNKRVKQIEDSMSFIPANLKNTAIISCAYGDLMLKKGKKDSAAYYFNAALQQCRQKDPAIFYAVALAHIDSDSGEASYAVDLLDKAIKRDKSNPEFYNALGNAYRRMQDGARAYKAYTEALEKDAHNAEAMYRLGKIFISQKNPDMYLKYLYRATSIDSAYAPAWYELYYHYYFKDPTQAMNCLEHYIAFSDQDEKNNYLLTDLLYILKKYKAAIENARRLIDDNNIKSDARLYKLIAYSYYELNDSCQALDYMRQYFHRFTDSSFIMKDFETMGELYARFPEKSDSAAACFAKAVSLEKDDSKKIEYYKKISGLFKKEKDYNNEAVWLGRYCQSNSKASNLDLFNWGMAHYLAGNYRSADTVFTTYITRYPDQTFGYYWKAKSDAAIDTSMEYGLAIPSYTRLVEVALKDSANKLNRKQLIEAYGYVAAYRANTQKDYPGAIDFFEKLLSFDPENADAKKYVAILTKRLSNKETTKNSK